MLHKLKKIQILFYLIVQPQINLFLFRFQALSVNNKKDMIRLAKYFEKYIICPDCIGADFRKKVNNKMVQTEDRRDLLQEEAEG